MIVLTLILLANAFLGALGYIHCPGQSKKRLKTDEAAEFLGVAPDTLVVWRCTKRYDLPYYKIGGAVRYDVDDLNAFLERRKVDEEKSGR